MIWSNLINSWSQILWILLSFEDIKKHFDPKIGWIPSCSKLEMKYTTIMKMINLIFSPIITCPKLCHVFPKYCSCGNHVQLLYHYESHHPDFNQNLKLLYVWKWKKSFVMLCGDSILAILLMAWKMFKLGEALEWLDFVDANKSWQGKEGEEGDCDIFERVCSFGGTSLHVWTFI